MSNNRLTIAGAVCTAVAFTVGRYIAPPAITENSKDYILAQAEAKGKEQARIKTEAIRANVQIQQQKQYEQQQTALNQKEQEIAKQKAEEKAQLARLELSPIDSFGSWTDIEDNWQIRGLNFRTVTTTTLLNKDRLGNETYTEKEDTSQVLFEFSIRRTNRQRPRLTRVIVEIFDENKQFMFPGICDISGTDASLYYVRTGTYPLKGKKPTYCRVAVAPVNMVKYRNDYPEYR
jgi:hypothetical protein